MKRQAHGSIDPSQTERLKAHQRAKVEHPFRYIKRVFGYDKVRYRSLEKDGERLHMLVASNNLMVGKTYILT